MPSLFSLVFASVMTYPVLASISSPNYLPFELEKRDCSFHRCDCQQVQCVLDFCFVDQVDPWILVDNAMHDSYGDDCGQWDWWKRNDPPAYCNNGLRKGNGLFYINRKFGSLGKSFDVKYKNTNAKDPHRGSVSASCRPVQDVRCTCHSTYNPAKNDCSNKCK